MCSVANSNVGRLPFLLWPVVPHLELMPVHVHGLLYAWPWANKFAGTLN